MPVVIFDLSRVIIFPRDKTYIGRLNPMHDELCQDPDYNFFKHFELNEPLLQLLESLKGKYHFYLYTTGHIQEVPEVKSRLEPIFEKMYSVENMPIAKDSAESYRYIARGLQRAPEDILYIDDTLSNIEMAQKAGLNVLVYQNNDQLFKDLIARGIA